MRGILPFCALLAACPGGTDELSGLGCRDDWTHDELAALCDEGDQLPWGLEGTDPCPAFWTGSTWVGPPAADSAEGLQGLSPEPAVDALGVVFVDVYEPQRSSAWDDEPCYVRNGAPKGEVPAGPETAVAFGDVVGEPCAGDPTCQAAWDGVAPTAGYRSTYDWSTCVARYESLRADRAGEIVVAEDDAGIRSLLGDLDTAGEVRVVVGDLEGRGRATTDEGGWIRETEAGFQVVLYELGGSDPIWATRTLHDVAADGTLTAVVTTLHEVECGMVIGR